MSSPWTRHLRPGLPLADVGTQGIAVQGALSAAGMVAQGLVRFLYNLLITWGYPVGVGVALVGEVNTDIAVALFASALVPLATANAATRHLALLRGSGDVDAMRGVTALLGRWTWVAAAVIGVGAGLYVGVGQPGTRAVLTGLLAAAYALYTFVRGTLLGLGLLPRATVWDLGCSLAAIAGIAVLVGVRASDWFLAPLVLCYGGYALASLGPLRGPSVPVPLRRELGAYVRVWLVQSVATVGFLQGSVLAARHWGDARAVGHYALALSLATPASLVSRSVQTVLFPRMAHAHGDGVGLAEQTDRATRWLVLFGVGLYTPLLLLAPTLAQVFRGGADAAPVLVVLLAATLLQNVLVAPVDNLMAREARWNRLVRNASVAGAVIGFDTWLVLGPRLGVLGVALGFLAGTAVTTLLPAAVVWRVDALAWGGLAARTAVAFAGLLAASWWIVTGGHGFVVQLVAVVVALAGWALVSWPDIRPLLSLRPRRRPA